MQTSMVVNIFWREAGYPVLHQSNTWATAECAASAWRTTAREMIAKLRASTAGLHGVRVHKFIRPGGAR